MAGTVGAVAAVVVVGSAWPRGRSTTRRRLPSPGDGESIIGEVPGRAMQLRWSIPAKGGSAGSSNQSGLVHAFNKADLIRSCPATSPSEVDIGDRVKKGGCWRRSISRAVQECGPGQGGLEQAKAELKLAEDRVVTAQADRQSATAQVQQNLDDVARYDGQPRVSPEGARPAHGSVRSPGRIGRLRRTKSKNNTKRPRHKRSSQAAVLTSRAQVSASEAHVAQANANVESAKADVDAAAAGLGQGRGLARITDHLSV